MKVLVTGAAGFTGTRMMQFLSGQEGVNPIGFIRNSPLKTHEGVNRFSSVSADLLDRDHLLTQVAEIRPDAIVHLAGLARGTLDALLLANVVGTKNILDAGYKANPDCRMLVVSSSAVYGYCGTAPIPESTPLKPLSEYGISKMAQDAFALRYHEQNDAKITVARPFNLAGPDQPESFVCGRIVHQVIEIEQGKKQALELLETRSLRDLIDVRDVVQGYWALLSHPEFSRDCSGKAYNLGSGNAYPIAKIIALVEEITGNHYDVRLPINPPPVHLLSQQSDNTRITALTGWTPKISLKDTLSDMLAAARVNSPP